MVGLSGLGALGAPARTAQAQAAPVGALAVPYLAQSTLLCGGAAVAMVERWWGRHQVFAEEFRPLVREDEGGIRTTDLAGAARDRGWTVRTVTGQPATVQQALADSIPVIALIEVARDRYHYVVIVAWRDDSVTYHDPAIAPYTTLPATEFAERWQGGDRWAMVMVPRSGGEHHSAPPSTPLPCGLDRVAAVAAQGAHAEAERLLDMAAARCPQQPLVQRERAGLRFRQGRHADAERLVVEYLRSAPRDTLGFQLLATLRYLRGDRHGALVAWNAIDRPRLDLLRISGLERVRFRVVGRASGLQLGATLTPGDLALARRRVADIPALRRGRVDYRPIAGGLAEVEIAALEDPRWPSPPRLLLGGARAVAGGVAELEVGSLLGAGESWDLAWRWRTANPEVAVRLDVPLRIGVPGTVGLVGEWEDWRFDGAEPDRHRRAATLDLRTWWTGALESRFAVRHERWRHSREALVLGIGFGIHDRNDRAGLVVQGEQALALNDHEGYQRAGAEAGFRSGSDFSRVVGSARIGFTWSSEAAPLGLRPVAGGNSGRTVPLRAHRWDTDDRLPLRRVGRSILHGGVALDRDVAMAGPFTFGAGAFLDVARVSDPAAEGFGDAWYADAGVGLRVGLPGDDRNTLRVDVARGLATDRRWGISVGLAGNWPLRPLGFD